VYLGLRHSWRIFQLRVVPEAANFNISSLILKLMLSIVLINKRPLFLDEGRNRFPAANHPLQFRLRVTPAFLNWLAALYWPGLKTFSAR
jgi:hypothetical protein